jgi:hypothetical protein
MLRPKIFKPENVGPRNVSANGDFAGDVIRGYLCKRQNQGSRIVQGPVN